MKPSVLYFIFTFVIPVLGDSNAFIFPPSYAGPNNQYVSNLVFTVGQPVTITWQNTTSGQISLWLMQDDWNSTGSCSFMTHALCARIAVLPSDDGHYPWTVSRLGIQTSPDYNFYYIDGFYETDPVEVNGDNHFTSAYFQITNASNPSPTTSGAASASATGLPTTTGTSSPQSSTPVGAIVGGVVGGLAVVGLTVIAALLLLRRRKGAQDQTQPQTQTMDNYPYGPVPVPGQGQMNSPTQNGSYNPHLQSGIAMKPELPASTGFSTRSAMSELHS